MRAIATNRKARHDYFILESYEAGLVLQGAEVKSLRQRGVNLADSFARPEKGEIFLYNMHINPYVYATQKPLDPTRPRKLLFHRREIDRLIGKVSQRGLTLIPLRLYFKKGVAKVELGLAKGKKIYDHREEIKRKIVKREMEKEVGAVRRIALLFLLTISLTFPSFARAFAQEQTQFVPLQEVCAVFRATHHWDPLTQKVIIRKSGQLIKFTVDNPKIAFNNSLEKMAIAPKLWKGTVALPLEFINKIFGKIMEAEIDWNPEKKLLFLKRGEEVKVVDIAQSLSNHEKKGKEVLSPFLSEKFKIKTIIVDPGHGGRDPGAIGRNGLKEKKITLDIAKKLRKLLLEEGFKVILTRKEDESLPLDDRVKIANYYKGDLFLSIHANAIPRRKRSRAGGFEVYFVSPTTDASALAVAARENAVRNLEKKKEEGDYKSIILVDMVYREFIRESAELAEVIIEKMDGKLDIKNRGVRQALFYVLRRVAMPSVLVEVAFVKQVLFPPESSRSPLRSSSCLQR
jgi:SsrA-binding protein